MYRNYFKRPLDLIVALALLFCLLPLFALFALWIKITSSGPVFFRQQRIGRSGRPFTMIKFRTMVQDAEHLGAGILCLKDDPRITSPGRFLRSLSLDELPQLINVARGDMSLIGPRPGLEYQVRKYTAFQNRRLGVRPGITGWAQVNGRNAIPWSDRIRFDVEYVDNCSFLLDVRILARTLGTVVFRDNLTAEKDYFKEQVEQTREGANL